MMAKQYSLKEESAPTRPQSRPAVVDADLGYHREDGACQQSAPARNAGFAEQSQQPTWGPRLSRCSRSMTGQLCAG